MECICRTFYCIERESDKRQKKYNDYFVNGQSFVALKILVCYSNVQQGPSIYVNTNRAKLRRVYK